MALIKIRKVQSSREQHHFVTFPWQIYHDDPLWVPPLVPDRLKMLDPRHSRFFTHGQAEFFMAFHDGQPAGTIMAAEDCSSNQMRGLQDCMIGFFECIDNQLVANALFDTARKWAAMHHLNRLSGPFNMDYDSAYGLLIAGRDRPPVVNCGHTPPYYQRLFEDFGFTPLRPDNLAFALDLSHETDAIALLHHSASRALEKGRISIREGNLADWDNEVERIFALLNRSLAHLSDYVGWDREAMKDSLEPFRKYADPSLILFAEVDGETVGFFPGIPNLNELLIQVNGLRTPLDYLKLLMHKNDKPQCLAIKSVLVLPEHWGSGVSLVLFDEMWRRARAKGYKWADLSLTSSENPKTPMLATRMGAVEYKRYRVYQYLF